MKVQIAFLIDCTNSMEKWIHAVWQQISDIIDNVQASQGLGASYEVAFVGYTDQDEFHHSPEFVIGFTQEIQKFKNQVRTIKTVDGVDWCENVLNGMENLVKLNWDPAAIRHVFHIADAPPHGVHWHEPWDQDRFALSDRDGVELSEVILRLPNVEQTLLSLHESLDKQAELMAEFEHLKFRVVDLAETIRAEDRRRDNRHMRVVDLDPHTYTQMLSPTISRIVRDSMTPGDPN